MKGAVAWVYFVLIVLLVGLIVLVIILSGQNFVSDAIGQINQAISG